MVWYRSRDTAPSFAAVDTFDDGDLSEYSGVTTDHFTQQNTVKEGTHALQIDGDAGAIISDVSTGGLDNYPAQGDRFSVWVRATNVDDGWSDVLFGSTGVSDGYHFFFRWPDDSIRIRERTNFTDIAQIDLTGGFSANTWYLATCEWDDGSTFGGSAGDMTLHLEDEGGTDYGTSSGNDTQFSSGDVGFRTPNMSSTSSSFFDHYIIENP